MSEVDIMAVLALQEPHRTRAIERMIHEDKIRQIPVEPLGKEDVRFRADGAEWQVKVGQVTSLPLDVAVFALTKQGRDGKRRPIVKVAGTVSPPVIEEPVAVEELYSAGEKELDADELFARGLKAGSIVKGTEGYHYKDAAGVEFLGKSSKTAIESLKAKPDILKTLDIQYGDPD